MPKEIRVTLPHEQIPDECPACGQKIDKRSAASIQHHSTPKHLPYAGKRSPARWR
jgi:hypothetical protein